MRPTLFALTLLAATTTFAISQSSTPKGIQPPQVNSGNPAPQGWILVGSRPQDYLTGVDTSSVAYLASKVDDAPGFGTLMQIIKTDNYAGKRVRFRASVRSENVREWAGLWMRVDKGDDPVAFDNMRKRSIKGTTGWTTYEVVLDVPSDATKICFGTLVSGVGKVWLSNVRFDIVGSDVPVTSIWPTNPSQTTPVFQH